MTDSATRTPAIAAQRSIRSPWDVLHPGRQFAVKLADSPVTTAFLLKRIADYFAGRPLDKLPKVLVEQQAEEEAEAEDAADQV